MIIILLQHGFQRLLITTTAIKIIQSTIIFHLDCGLHASALFPFQSPFSQPERQHLNLCQRDSSLLRQNRSMTKALHYTQCKRQNLICLPKHPQLFFFFPDLISYQLWPHSFYISHTDCYLTRHAAVSRLSELTCTVLHGYFSSRPTQLPSFLQDFTPACFSL